MFKYFDQTFFKFLFGFMAIIALSFLVTSLAISSQSDDPQTASPQTAELTQ